MKISVFTFIFILATTSFCSPHYDLYALPMSALYSKEFGTKIFVGKAIEESELKDTVLEYDSFFDGSVIDTFKCKVTRIVVELPIVNTQINDTITAVNIFGLVVAKYGSFSYTPTSGKSKVYYISNDGQIQATLNALWYYERNEKRYETTDLTIEDAFINEYKEVTSSQKADTILIRNLRNFIKYTGLEKYLFWSDSDYRKDVIFEYIKSSRMFIGLLILIFLVIAKFNKVLYAVVVLMLGFIGLGILFYFGLTDRRYEENYNKPRITNGINYLNKHDYFSGLGIGYTIKPKLIDDIIFVKIRNHNQIISEINLAIDTMAFSNHKLTKETLKAILDFTTMQISRNKHIVNWFTCSNNKSISISGEIDSLGMFLPDNEYDIERTKDLQHVSIELTDEDFSISVDFFPYEGFGIIPRIYNFKENSIKSCGDFDNTFTTTKQVAFFNNDTILLVDRILPYWFRQISNKNK